MVPAREGRLALAGLFGSREHHVVRQPVEIRQDHTVGRTIRAHAKRRRNGRPRSETDADRRAFRGKSPLVGNTAPAISLWRPSWLVEPAVQRRADRRAMVGADGSAGPAAQRWRPRPVRDRYAYHLFAGAQ